MQIKTKAAPLFELCGAADDENSKWFLFPHPFDFWFYKTWCYNQGGEIAIPKSTENFHEMVDPCFP